MEQERQYLSDKEIAADPEFRGLFSASTLQKHRVKGTGPQYIQFGAKCLYTRPWTREWIAAKVVNSTSEVA